MTLTKTTRVRDRVRRLGTVIAVTMFAVFAVATTAYADSRLLDTDHVKVTSGGFYFGDGTWSNTGYDKKGDVKWLIDVDDVTPTLTGKLSLWAVNGECARIRIDYFTTSSFFLTTKYGGTVCAPDNGQHEWTVTQSQYTSNKAGKIEVSIEHQLSNQSWAIVGSDWATLNTFVDDKVEVTSSDGNGIYGIGFGGSGWSGGNPTSFGTVVWNLSGGQITPHLTGTLHLEAVAGDCVRIRLDYYAEDGPDAGTDFDLLATKYGGTVCAIDNAHYPFSVDQQPYTSNTIHHVRIAIEYQDSATSYHVIDSTLSYFGT